MRNQKEDETKKKRSKTQIKNHQIEGWAELKRPRQGESSSRLQLFVHNNMHHALCAPGACGRAVQCSAVQVVCACTRANAITLAPIKIPTKKVVLRPRPSSSTWLAVLQAFAFHFTCCTVRKWKIAPAHEQCAFILFYFYRVTLNRVKINNGISVGSQRAQWALWATKW